MQEKTANLILLIAALAIPGHALRAQEAPDLPDSTYLRLTLDLPALANYSYEILGTGRVTNVYAEFRNVDVDRCTLSFENWVQRVPGSTYAATYAIPLNAIDSGSLSIRVAHPRGGRYDPQPWLLRIAMKSDSDARIATGTVESRYERKARNVELMVKDYQAAAQIRAWLIDGANRCETWKTTPIKPIR